MTPRRITQFVRSIFDSSDNRHGLTLGMIPNILASQLTKTLPYCKLNRSRQWLVLSSP